MTPKLAHSAEYAAVYLAFKLCRALGPATASTLGGTIARIIGPLIPVSAVADENLRAAMPELTAAQRKTIIREIWENLGRTAAELTHIGRLRETAAGPGYAITGAEHLTAAVAAGGPSLILTGHLANWEIIPPAAYARGMDLAFMYRAASNSLVDNLILHMRESDMGRKLSMFPKGGPGARAAYAHLTRHGHLGMLIDQKLDNGIAVPFFGIPAMTAPALAAFALKFRCPIIPIHVVRTGPARLHIICEPPLPLPDTGNKTADTLTLMTTANQILEGWIRDNPGSWLWLHHRWPKLRT